MRATLDAAAAAAAADAQVADGELRLVYKRKFDYSAPVRERARRAPIVTNCRRRRTCSCYRMTTLYDASHVVACVVRRTDDVRRCLSISSSVRCAIATSSALDRLCVRQAHHALVSGVLPCTLEQVRRVVAQPSSHAMSLTVLRRSVRRLWRRSFRSTLAITIRAFIGPVRVSALCFVVVALENDDTRAGFLKREDLRHFCFASCLSLVSRTRVAPRRRLRDSRATQWDVSFAEFERRVYKVGNVRRPTATDAN